MLVAPEILYPLVAIVLMAALMCGIGQYCSRDHRNADNHDEGR